MISVRGEQYYDGADPDSTELMTEGTLEQTADGLRIRAAVQAIAKHSRFEFVPVVDDVSLGR